MRIDLLTIFPEMIRNVVGVGLLGKALENNVLSVHAHDIRDFATGKHRSVDDTPYGGGAGMLMQCGPIFDAVESLRPVNSLTRVVLMSPRGKRLDQAMVRDFAQAPDLALICARYEGVDERVSEALVTDEVSIGDYVLSGGELPALVLVEAISRMLPGVIGDWESVTTDSFYTGILGPPQYTRPVEFRGRTVPEVLRSGNHAAIRRWKRKEALRTTLRQRPDLLQALERKKQLNKEDYNMLAEIESESPIGEKENTS